MDHSGRSAWPANGSHSPQPHPTFSLPILALLAALFLALATTRSGLSHKGFLGRDAEHLLIGRTHREHRLQKKAHVGSIANGSQPLGRTFIAIVQLRGILHHQHHPFLLLRLLLRLLPMRSAE